MPQIQLCNINRLHSKGVEFSPLTASLVVGPPVGPSIGQLPPPALSPARGIERWSDGGNVMLTMPPSDHTDPHYTCDLVASSLPPLNESQGSQMVLNLDDKTLGCMRSLSYWFKQHLMVSQILKRDAFPMLVCNQLIFYFLFLNT